MRKVAIFGSRSYPMEHPYSFWIEDTIRALWEEEPTIIVTTEASGVCDYASSHAILMKIPVIVFKPVRLNDPAQEDAFGVDEWRIAPEGSSIVHHNAPTWADWQSSLNFRSLLMVDRAERGIAFHADKSRGTQFEIDLFAMHEKPCEVVTP